MNSSTPPTKIQKDTPRNTPTSINDNPKILSVIPTRYSPMVTKCLRLSSPSSPNSSPLQKQRIMATISQICTMPPTPINIEQISPMHCRSWKTDWQNMSFDRQTSAEISEYVWQQGTVICFPYTRLIQSERQPLTMRSDCYWLSTQNGISILPQSQQDMEKMRMRKVSRLTMEVTSSLFRTISWLF